MMKKVSNIFRLFLVIVLVISNVLLSTVQGATAERTMKDLRVNLQKLQAEKKKQQSAANYTKSQINTKRNSVIKAHNDIEKSEQDIAIAKKSIEKSNEEIEALLVRSRELMVFHEMLDNQDSYYEYVTGAASMTELIMRQDAIELLIEHNKNNVEKLEQLIEKNEALQVDLKKHQITLEQNIVTYEKSINSMSRDLASITEITEDINAQIRNQKALIDYYVGIGCKDNQLLSACDSIANNSGWLKPLTRGRVTSAFGYRIHPISKVRKFHDGVDIGGNKEGTPIYSATAGKVIAVTPRASCGGNKVYIHSRVKNVTYTVYYMHLLEVNVKVGDVVTTNTKIGSVGGGKGTAHYDKCSTGAHLHFSVAKGLYLKDYQSYSTLVARAIKPPGFPGVGGTFTSRTQWFA